MNAAYFKYLVLSSLALASCAPESSTDKVPEEDSVGITDSTEMKWTPKIAEPQLGDQWIYSVTTEYAENTYSARDGKVVENVGPVEYTQVVEVAEVDPKMPGAAYRFATTNTEDGKLISKDKFTLVDDMLVIESVQPTDESGELGNDVIAFNPNYTLVPSNLVAGYSWSESHLLGTVPMVDAMTVIGKETITVPAGEFEAWRIRRNRSLGTTQATSFKEDYWFVAGVGIAKIEMERFDAGNRVWHRETKLREKRVSVEGE